MSVERFGGPAEMIDATRNTDYLPLLSRTDAGKLHFDDYTSAQHSTQKIEGVMPGTIRIRKIRTTG